MFKRLPQLAYVFVIVSAFLATTLQAGEIIFRPAPGLNDGSDTGSLVAGKDATGGAGDCVNPSTNYGDNPLLFALPISNCNLCNTSTWVRFDLSTLPANIIRVHVGFTHLPHTTQCFSNCNADFYFYPVTSEWNEMTVSNANPPSRGAASVGPINITFPNNFGLREYDITEMYQQWKAEPADNFGFEISSPTVGCNNAAVGFYSYSSDAEDEALRPYLRIETTEADTHSIGGEVSNLTGTVVLQNNEEDDLTLNENGAFTFANALEYGSAYSVTVLTQPAGQRCSVENGKGTVTSNVTNVSVICSAVVLGAEPIPGLSEWALLMLAVSLMVMAVSYTQRKVG